MKEYNLQTSKNQNTAMMLEVVKPDIYSRDFVSDIIALANQNPQSPFDFSSALEAQYQDSWFANSLPARVAKAGHYDLMVSSHKSAARASMGAIALIEIVGATRAPSVLAMSTVAKIQEQTGNPFLAGGATALFYGSWCCAVAHTINSGVNNLQSSVSAVAESESIKQKISRLPGLDNTKEHNFATRGFRGAAAYVGGVALYIMAAGMHGQSDTDRQKLARSIGIDAGIFMGLIATGAMTAVLAVEQDNPELAHAILDKATDSKIVLMSLLAAGLLNAGYSRAMQTIKNSTK